MGDMGTILYPLMVGPLWRQLEQFSFPPQDIEITTLEFAIETIGVDIGRLHIVIYIIVGLFGFIAEILRLIVVETERTGIRITKHTAFVVIPSASCRI